MIFELILIGAIVLLTGFGLGIMVGWNLSERDSKKDIEDLREEIRYWKRKSEDRNHWINTYRKMWMDAESKNTLIINELPKGANIPKFDKF